MVFFTHNKNMLLEMIKDADKAFPEHLAFFMLHHLHHPERTVLFHQIEERLSTTGVGIHLLFSELYQVRKQRLRIIFRMTESYLENIQSAMSVRNYLASIWALTHGAAAILNSSFYQRYLGSRDTLRVAYIDQALAMPKKQMSSTEQFA